MKLSQMQQIRIRYFVERDIIFPGKLKKNFLMILTPFFSDKKKTICFAEPKNDITWKICP